VAGLLVDLFDFNWAFAAGAVIALIPIVLVLRMPETLIKNRKSGSERSDPNPIPPTDDVR
jgi:hypothetical protein